MTVGLESKQPTKEKKKSFMSADEYNRISKILALRLKSLEEQGQDKISVSQMDSETEGDSSSHAIQIFRGCKWKDLLTWYLTEVNDIALIY